MSHACACTCTCMTCMCMCMWHVLMCNGVPAAAGCRWCVQRRAPRGAGGRGARGRGDSGRPAARQKEIPNNIRAFLLM